MNNIIVRETAGEIRAIARYALRGNWGKVMVGYVIYFMLSVVVSDALSIIFDSASYGMEVPYLDRSITVSFVSNLYTAVTTGALILGLSSFYISFFRKKDINSTYVFNGFEYFIKSLGLFVMISIFSFLWALLFFIPGIIAAIRYSQAFYILADNPNKGVFQCIDESKTLMKGNKGRFFYLMLTFIGWSLLASIPYLIIPTTTSVILGTLIGYVAMIPLLFVYVYVFCARTVFYELVSGHLIAKKEDQNNFAI